MTLKDQMQTDLNIFVNPDEFGAACILTMGGSDSDINVLLDKVEEAETGLFIDVVTAKKSDIVGIVIGDVFTIEGKAYHTVVSKPLYEDDLMATLRIEP